MTSLSYLREEIKKDNLDGVLISTSSQIGYLTGYFGFSSIERDAYMLVTNNKAYLFTNPLYNDEVKKRCPDVIVIQHTAQHPFALNFKNIVSKYKCQTIGFESNNLSVSEYLKITAQIDCRLVNIDLSHIRSKKTPDEIESIKKACLLAQKAYLLTKEKIKPHMSEAGLALLFELTVKKLGGDLSFPTIVAFGKNAAIPHHHSDETKLKTNDVVLMDFGVKLNNYCSDITRTFFLGKATNEYQKLYHIVKNAQKAAIDFINMSLATKKEILAQTVDDEARNFIIEKGHPSIPHSLGHGIGIEVHEAPSLSPNSKDILTEGMVFSIEPGIYVPNKLGIRIEDLFLIQNNQLIQLTGGLTS
ncbi:MAG: aminopeptidase P family protein [Candidatus Levybacteria bacterium]|nr:aminopeptidase P family protein [Candidatus Levybacteria bacterium]